MPNPKLKVVMGNGLAPPRPSVTGGHKCDRCGALFVPELSAVWVDSIERPGQWVEMRLCLPCIESLLDQHMKVAVIGDPDDPDVVNLQRQVFHIPRTVIGRAEALIETAAMKAMKRIERQRPYHQRGEPLIAALQSAIRRECNILIKAAELKPSVRRAVAEEKQIRKDVRKDLADRLDEARRRMAALRIEIAKNESQAFVRRFMGEHDDRSPYPSVPAAAIEATEFGDGIPQVAGVYFLWADGIVEYVGQSSNLKNRLQLRSHHVMKQHHMISFVPLERRELTWAECWYIGALRPTLNFGRSASHAKAALAAATPAP